MMVMMTEWRQKKESPCLLTVMTVACYTGQVKNGTILYVLTSSNINRFLKYFHYRNQKTTCNNAVTKNNTTP